MSGDLSIEAAAAQPPARIEHDGGRLRTPSRPRSASAPPARPRAAPDAPQPQPASSAGEPQLRLQQQLERLRTSPGLRARRLDYEVREDGVVVVKVRDAETDKVILTVPPEEQLELARRLEQYLGTVLDETA